jgi:hypothetical protein
MTPSYPISMVSHQLTLPLDFPVFFLNLAMYSWMKYHHYRLGRANVILVNTFYELEKPPIDAVWNEVLGTPYGKVSVA